LPYLFSKYSGLAFQTLILIFCVNPFLVTNTTGSVLSGCTKMAYPFSFTITGGVNFILPATGGLGGGGGFFTILGGVKATASGGGGGDGGIGMSFT
jgi:hypothetical protein